MLSNVECNFLKPACEGEIRLTLSANEFNIYLYFSYPILQRYRDNGNITHIITFKEDRRWNNLEDIPSYLQF